MKNKLLLVCFSMLLFIGCIPKFSMKAEYGFQKNTDIVRAQHLKYYGQLIEEYKEKTDKYPFEGESDLPIYIYIAIAQQIDFIKKHPLSILYKEISLNEFKKELEKGLKRKIEIKYDPQSVPQYVPSFYIYMIKNKNYFFSVHLFNEYSFTRKISEYYNKLEISNVENYEIKIWIYKDLMNNEDFIKLINAPIQKEDFFKHRQEKYHKMENSKK